jgi:hypothetical protein
VWNCCTDPCRRTRVPECSSTGLHQILNRQQRKINGSNHRSFKASYARAREFSFELRDSRVARSQCGNSKDAASEGAAKGITQDLLVARRAARMVAQGQRRTELAGVGFTLARMICNWIETPPIVVSPPAIRQGTLSRSAPKS